MSVQVIGENTNEYLLNGHEIYMINPVGIFIIKSCFKKRRNYYQQQIPHTHMPLPQAPTLP